MSTREAGWFHRVLLPPIILQSMIIGGGYSTGREVVEYAAKHGAAGWMSVLVIFVGFSLFSFLVFELARVTRSYDYKSFIRQLIGPLWPLFDLVLVVMFLFVIAVMIAAVGSILERTLGLPSALGVLFTFVVVAALAYMGEQTIERFKTVGTVLLYVGYAIFSGIVLTASWDGVVAGLRASEGGDVGAAAISGLLYVGYNISVYPMVLFCLYRQQGRADAAVSGVVAGVMMTLPFLLTWLCLLAFPTPDVLAADVPWLEMLADVAPAWVMLLYGVVVGWTLVETSIGGVHGMEDRIDKNIDDLPRAIASRIDRLSRTQRSVGAAMMLLTALAMSRFGIVALVASGYGAMAYVFLALLALPLLSVGVVKIVRAA